MTTKMQARELLSFVDNPKAIKSIRHVCIWVSAGMIVGLTSVFLDIKPIAVALPTCFGLIAGLIIENNKRIAIQDALTGLYNRRYLIDSLNEHIELTNRYGESFCLMMFDLDGFKQVNDTFGHLAGDKTLRAISKVLRKECRTMDITARYGGEEFMIICPHTDQEEGYQLAERIRKVISQLPARTLGYPGPQTISVGVIAVYPGQNLNADDLISQVDKALYEAKKRGKNCVIPGALCSNDLN